VIAAEGEQKASRALKEAADVIAQSPAALQLRYLQSLNMIATEKNSTIIFPIPMDFVRAFTEKWRRHHSITGCWGWRTLMTWRWSWRNLCLRLFNSVTSKVRPYRAVRMLFFGYACVLHAYVILPYVTLFRTLTSLYEENKLCYNQRSQKSTLNVKLILANESNKND